MATAPHGDGPAVFPLHSKSQLDGATDVARESTVLVTYASAHGSTRGIAERIAAQLGARGTRVAVRPVDEIEDVETYDAVVLGSPVLNQEWMPAATGFLRRNADALAVRRTWLFSVGSFGDTHPVIGRFMMKEPRDIREIQQAVRPRGYRVFAGAIERHQWPWASRLFFHLFGGRFGDNRDWPVIDAWAGSISERLRRPEADI